jgi:hypothetical protein
MIRNAFGAEEDATHMTDGAIAAYAMQMAHFFLSPPELQADCFELMPNFDRKKRHAPPHDVIEVDNSDSVSAVVPLSAGSSSSAALAADSAVAPSAVSDLSSAGGVMDDQSESGASVSPAATSDMVRRAIAFRESFPGSGGFGYAIEIIVDSFGVPDSHAQGVHERARGMKRPHSELSGPHAADHVGALPPASVVSPCPAELPALKRDFNEAKLASALRLIATCVSLKLPVDMTAVSPDFIAGLVRIIDVRAQQWRAYGALTAVRSVAHLHDSIFDSVMSACDALTALMAQKSELVSSVLTSGSQVTQLVRAMRTAPPAVECARRCIKRSLVSMCEHSADVLICVLEAVDAELCTVERAPTPATLVLLNLCADLVRLRIKDAINVQTELRVGQVNRKILSSLLHTMRSFSPGLSLDDNFLTWCVVFSCGYPFLC